jgi:hypothetical protein
MKVSEKRRHTRLAELMGDWTTRVIGKWIESGFAAFKTDAAFSEGYRLDLECNCDGDHLPGVADGCTFVDSYEPFTKDPGRIGDLIDRATRGYGEPAKVGIDLFVLRPFRGGVVAYLRAYTPDGRWLGVQDRYIAAAEAISRTERWEIRWPVASPGIPIAVPMLVGFRGEEVVALVMPLKIKSSLSEERSPESGAVAEGRGAEAG